MVISCIGCLLQKPLATERVLKECSACTLNGDYFGKKLTVLSLKTKKQKKKHSWYIPAMVHIFKEETQTRGERLKWYMTGISFTLLGHLDF